MDPNICCANTSQDQQSSPAPPPQDCLRKVKISRVLEPFLPRGGGVVVVFGDGEGVDDGEGEEGCGVDVPPKGQLCESGCSPEHSTVGM